MSWAGLSIPVTSARPVHRARSTSITRSTSATGTPTYTGVPTAANGTTLGAIVFPLSPTGTTGDPFYTSSPSNQYPAAPTTTTVAPFTPYAQNPTYVPDLTNNPLHSFESFRFPNQNYPGFTPSFTPQQLGGSPARGTTAPANADYDHAQLYIHVLPKL